MTITIIAIQTRTEGAVSCRAIVRGRLALHQTYRPGPDKKPWTITHVPSGRVVAFVATGHEARCRLKRMAALPWPTRPSRSPLTTRSHIKRYFGEHYDVLSTAIAQARKAQP